MVTPLESNSSPPRTSRSSERRSSVLRAEVQTPFRYPPSLVDRERYFQGREKELSQCHDALTISKGGQHTKPMSLRSVIVSGPGGCGKTELAHQFISRYRDEYDVVILATADDETRMSQQYDSIAAKLGLLSLVDKPTPDECREALKSWFKNPIGIDSFQHESQSSSSSSNERTLTWLLVLDNVDEWLTIEPFWPFKGHGSVLVTSRRPDIYPELQLSGHTTVLKLDMLPAEEAALVLEYYAGPPGDTSKSAGDAARMVATELEGLPLAVMQVGSYIKQCQMTVQDFARVHRNDSDFHNVYLDRSPLHSYEHNLESVWGLESLSIDPESSKGAFSVLCVLAFLDSELIQMELLIPDATRTQLTYYPKNEPEFQQRFKLLLGTSLVHRVDGMHSLNIHRMVQKVVRAKLSVDAAHSLGVFTEVLTRIASRWPYIHRRYAIGSQGDITRWPRCVELLPHLATLSQGYFELRERGQLTEPNIDLAELLCEASG